MDLLDLYGRIFLDTSGYEQGLNRAESAADSMIQSYESIVQNSDNVANSFETQNNMLAFLQEQYTYAQKAVSNISNEFNEAVSATGLMSTETVTLADSLAEAQKEADKAAKRLADYQASIDTVANSSGNASQNIESINSAISSGGSAIEAYTGAAVQANNATAEYFESLANGVAEIGNRISEIPNQFREFADTSKNAFSANSNQLKVLKNEYKEAKDKVKELKLELSASVNSTGAASEQSKELAKQLKEAESAAANAKKEIADFNEKTYKTSETLKAIGTAAKTGAAAVSSIATAVAGAGAAMVKVTSDTAAYADSIDKASQKLGVSAEFYQEWEAVLQHSGTSMSSMTSTFKTLANAAQDMSKDQQAAFEKLGISIQEVANLSTEDLFEKVISGLQQMESGTERTAIATDLLGRGAMEMGALLNTSAEDTQKMIDTVHELGGVMSDEAIKSGAAFQDSLQDLKTSLSGLKNNLATEFLPSMIDVMDGLADVFSGKEGGIEKAAQGISNFVDELAEQLPKVTEFGGEIAISLMDGISDNLDGISQVAVDIIGGLITEIIDYAPTLIDGAVTIVNQLLSFLQENAYVIANGAVSIITSLVNGISELLPDLVPAAVQIVLQLAKGITDNVGQIVSSAGQLIISLGLGLVEAIPEILYIPEEICTSLADSLVHYDWSSAAEAMMNSLIDSLDTAQKKVQVWLDNTFSGGQLYGGDIANVASTDFIENLRTGTDIMIGELSKAQESFQTHYDEGKETLINGQNEITAALEENAENFKEQSEKSNEIIAQSIQTSNNNIANTITATGNNIVSSQKKSGEKQKSILVQNMEVLERLYKQRQIDEEKYQALRLDYLEKHQDLESDEWTKYYDNVMTYYEKLADTEQKAAEKAAKEQQKAAEKLAEEQRKAAEKAAKERRKNFKSIIDDYEKQVANIQKSIDTFADKLKGAYKDFYTFEKDEEGNITGAYASDKMTRAGNQLEEYYNQLLKFSERGIGEDMMKELQGLSQEEGLAVLEYWNSLSDKEFENLQEKYDKINDFSNKISEKLYQSEAEETASAFVTSIGDAVKDTDQFGIIGEMMLDNIISGLNSGAFDITAVANRISAAFADYFSGGGTTSSGYTSTASAYTQTAPTTAKLPVSENTVNTSNPQTSNASKPESEFSITLNIDEFNNYTNDDIDSLASKVLIAIQDKIIRRKAALS